MYPITARYRKIHINIHDVGDYTLLQAISAAVALTDNRSCNYTVSQKGSHLIFDNNFGKCGPIFKILSPIDSWEQSLCTKISTSFVVCCYTILWNLKIQKCYSDWYVHWPLMGGLECYFYGIVRSATELCMHLIWVWYSTLFYPFTPFNFS